MRTKYATIPNARNRPLNFAQGTVPDLSGALKDYFQELVFSLLVKTVVGFQTMETLTQINFQGVIQPFSPRELMMVPEGQRAWSWFYLHADPVLTLQVDDVVNWLGKQTRVMSRKDFGQYFYVEYTLVQDYSGSGPASP